MLDFSKQKLLPNSDPEILAEIGDQCRNHLFKGLLRQVPATPAHYMRRMRNLLWMYPEIADDTITIASVHYQQYVMLLSVDRDFFELSIFDKTMHTARTLLSWQFVSDWEGVTWEEFWVCMKGWLSDGLAQLKALQAAWDAQEGPFNEGCTEIPEER